ncbi:MAG: hypothetical protein WA142_08560 [Rugosibacter sp.]
MKLLSSDILESRPDGHGVIFVGTPRPSTIEAGDNVTLKSDGVTISCEVEAFTPNGVITGKITGFEQVADVTFKGMTMDDKISFSEQHVFGCSKQDAVEP